MIVVRDLDEHRVARTTKFGPLVVPVEGKAGGEKAPAARGPAPDPAGRLPEDSPG